MLAIKLGRQHRIRVCIALIVFVAKGVDFLIYLYNMFIGLQTNKGKLYYKMLVKYSLTFAAKRITGTQRA